MKTLVPMRNSRVPTVLRWIAVIPGAVAASRLASSAVSVALDFRNEMESTYGVLPDFWTAALTAGLASIAFIRAGAWIAPTHKTPVVYGLGIFWILGSTFLLYPNFKAAKGWAVWIYVVSVVVAVVEIVLRFEKEKGRLKNKPTVVIAKIESPYSRN